MTGKEKIIDKVRKLLELSKSDNVNEAGNAAAMAQELMTKHAISEVMLKDAGEFEEDIEHDLLHAVEGRSTPTWKGQIGTVMCEVNDCKCYRDGSTANLMIIGTPSNADTVRYLYSYVVREIDRLALRSASVRGSVGKTWMNNFRLGAAQEVCRRLQEAHRAARAAMKKEASDSDTMGTGVALVRVNNALAKMDAHKAEVEEYGKRRLRLRKRSGSRSNYDHGARQAGKRAGASIDLSKGSGGKGLGSGSRGHLKG